MKVKNAKFVISAVSPSQYPKSELLEVAFVGRSNVGKSSVINALLNRKNLAYSGSRQGMTRQINYYNLDDELFFVDLPGYGYAQVSKGEQNLWGKIIQDYLNVRPQLYTIVMLVDIRHKPSGEDLMMYRWIQASGLGFVIVATKSDKINKTQIKGQLKIIADGLGIADPSTIIPISAMKKVGIDKLWEAIDALIIEEEE